MTTLKRITRIAAWPFQRLVLLLVLRISPAVRYRRVQVVQFTAARQQVDPRLVEAIAAALQLVATHDHRWLPHFDRRVRRIIIANRGQPMWIPSLGAILLRAEYVTTAPAESLALTLVHETMHARLWRLGIHYPAPLRRRIEEICTGAEVEFAKRLPNAERYIEISRAKLVSEWWIQTP